MSRRVLKTHTDLLVIFNRLKSIGLFIEGAKLAIKLRDICRFIDFSDDFFLILFPLKKTYVNKLRVIEPLIEQFLSFICHITSLEIQTFQLKICCCTITFQQNMAG